MLYTNEKLTNKEMTAALRRSGLTNGQRIVNVRLKEAGQPGAGGDERDGKGGRGRRHLRHHVLRPLPDAPIHTLQSVGLRNTQTIYEISPKLASTCKHQQNLTIVVPVSMLIFLKKTCCYCQLNWSILKQCQ